MINSYRTLACFLLGILFALGAMWHSDIVLAIIVVAVLPWPYVARETLSGLEDLYQYIQWARREKELKSLESLAHNSEVNPS